MFVVAHNGARVWGGAERGTTLILQGLQRRGHRVLLLCNDPLVARAASELGVPAEVLPLGGDVAVHHAVRFARALRGLRPDALLLGTFKKLWLGALAGRLAGVPRIVARIGLETDTPRSWKYRAVISRWVDVIVLKADDVRERYRAALPGVPEERIVTVHGGIVPREPRGAPGAVRAELGLGDGAAVVGSVGRLVGQKRFDRLLHALALLPPHVHAVVAGEGAERPALEALARELGVEERFHLLGERNDVGDVLAALDVFLVTSDREMLSFAMLEAMAAGVPVVSTPVSGAAEALAPSGDGERAGLVAGFDPAELAAAVERLLSDAAGRAQMGRAAARRAVDRFGFERMLDRWERVLGGAS